MKKGPIYLDNHATTPMDPRVLRELIPFFVHRFANAASFQHSMGADANKKVEKARKEIAKLIGADPREIVFTSGSTESNNLALKGVAGAYKDKGDHIVTLATEHKSVLDPCKRLETEGFRVTYLPVKPDGLLDLKTLEKALTPKTVLISVMMAHNEIGVIQPVAEIGNIAQARGILFHSDAAQAAGKIPIDVRKMNIDLLSFTAHKMYGPKGVGALYVRKKEPRVKLLPLFDGGGHETGLRSGTLNVPGIVGFAKACEISRLQMKKDAEKTSLLRNRLKDALLKEFSDARVNGNLEHRLPNNLNISLPGISAKDLMAKMPEVAISSGSACLSSSVEPSYTLRALGLSEDLRKSSLRFGLGRFTTQNEIDSAIKYMVKAKGRVTPSG